MYSASGAVKKANRMKNSKGISFAVIEIVLIATQHERVGMRLESQATLLLSQNDTRNRNCFEEDRVSVEDIQSESGSNT